MKEPLYYQHPPVADIWTQVTSSWEQDGVVHITLADTIFFPEGGGQPADGGWIGEYPLLDVYLRDTANAVDEDEVVHVLEQKPLEDRVHCRLDKDRRWHHSRHHSAQHLLSALVQKLWQWQTVGFHLGEEHATVDFSCEEWTEEQLEILEQKANQFLWSNVPVHFSVLDKDSQSNLDETSLNLRGTLPDQERLRIVELVGVDRSPCCGTHVRALGQIGLLKCLRTEKVRQRLRLFFVCGSAALADYRQKHCLVRELSHSLTTGPEELIHRVTEDGYKLKHLHSENRRLQQDLLALRAEELVKQGKVVLTAIDQLDQADAWSAAILAAGAIAVVLQTGQRVYIKHNGQIAIDCGACVRDQAGHYGGRGGGGATSAQSFFPDETNAASWAQAMQRLFRDALENRPLS